MHSFTEEILAKFREYLDEKGLEYKDDLDWDVYCIHVSEVNCDYWETVVSPNVPKGALQRYAKWEQRGAKGWVKKGIMDVEVRFEVDRTTRSIIRYRLPPKTEDY